MPFIDIVLNLLIYSCTILLAYLHRTTSPIRSGGQRKSNIIFRRILHALDWTSFSASPTSAEKVPLSYGRILTRRSTNYKHWERKCTKHDNIQSSRLLVDVRLPEGCYGRSPVDRRRLSRKRILGFRCNERQPIPHSFHFRNFSMQNFLGEAFCLPQTTRCTDVLIVETIAIVLYVQIEFLYSTLWSEVAEKIPVPSFCCHLYYCQAKPLDKYSRPQVSENTPYLNILICDRLRILLFVLKHGKNRYCFSEHQHNNFLNISVKYYSTRPDVAIGRQRMKLNDHSTTHDNDREISHCSHHMHNLCIYLFTHTKSRHS
uniref:Secreted protein n=1 Tax=Heterorhabditis bacteriophora TaxID=37862 RepID=A0A1I7WF46_HETBA